MSDRDYLDRYSKRTADTRIVTLIADNGDGTMRAKYIDSEAEIDVSKPHRTDFYSLNSRVEIQDPAASRTVQGAMPVITTTAPVTQRGLSKTTPDEQLTFRDGATIIAVDPDPLELVAGGEPAVQVIIGSGFTGAGVYEGRGAAPDPTIADDSAPVVTATKITRTISADVNSPRGEFDFLVDGVRARKAMRVRAPLPGELSIRALLVAGQFSPDGYATETSDVTPCLWVLDPDTLELLGTFEQTTFQDWDYTGGPLAVIGDIAYMIFTNNNGTDDGSHVARVNLRSLADEGPLDIEFAANDPLSILGEFCNMLAHEGDLLIAGERWSSGVEGLHTVSPGTGVPALRYVFGGSGSTAARIAPDLSGNILVRKNDSTLTRVQLSDWSDNGAADGALKIIAAIREIAWTAESGYGAPTGNVWACGTGISDGKIFRFNAANLATLETIVLSGSQVLGPPVQVRDSIFAVDQIPNHLYRVRSGFQDDLGALPAGPFYLRTIATDGESIFVVADDGVVRKFDTDGALLASSDPIQFTGELDLNDLLIVT